MPFSIKITILSDTRYLAVLRDLMAAIAKISGKKRFPKRAQKACTLALIEAVDNAIFHAHRRRAVLPINIEVRVEKGAVVMIVTDCGPGLDHRAVHAPKLVATKGRGLFIIDRLMDGVETKKSGRGHTLTLKMNV